MSTVTDIRGVLIQIGGARLLLPNATIAEVLSYADPEPVDGAPHWLLGRMRWRGWQVPMVSFARLSGTAATEAGGLGSKVLVLKALGGDAGLPHFAVLTQGFPRLVTVSPASLAPDGAEPAAALPEGVLLRVLHKGEPAFIPDIGAIEDAIRSALSQAA